MMQAAAMAAATEDIKKRIKAFSPVANSGLNWNHTHAEYK
jgi:hypothetical protein